MGMQSRERSNFCNFERNIQSLVKFYILNLFRILEIEKDFVACKIRNKVPETIKMSSPLESFKSKIKWKPDCACHLCFFHLH